MEVILLKNVANLGVLGDKVKVRPGYGRNYLLPGGFAAAATPENLQAFEERRAEFEREAAEALANALSRKGQLEAQPLVVASKAGDEGRLFGSVGTHDIAAAAREAGLELLRSEVRLSGGAFRQLGEYQVELRLHPEVEAVVTLQIVPED